MRVDHVLIAAKLRDIVIPCQRHTVTENRSNLVMETVGNRIRKRRNELGYTQGQLGKASGLGTATISGLELGTQAGTTKLHKIAEALRCRVQWLETGNLPIEEVPGVREPPPLARQSVHGIFITREGAEIGAEWDKIEGDEYKQLARDFIYGIVAAQKRASRVPSIELTTSTKRPKNKDRRQHLE